MGEWIALTAEDGHTLDAYRAMPAGKPRGGLVVVQEIFGVNPHIRAVCEGFAGEGYATVAPALFDRVRQNVELGYTPEATPEGRGLRERIGWDAPLRDIEAAAAALRPHGRVGVVGFCWGGSLAFLAACRRIGAAAVAYYGGQIIQFVDEQPKVPVMMHFGETDTIITAAHRETIRARRPEAEIFVYPAGHGFNCDERRDYDAACARIARERTLAFLAKHVG